MRNIFKAIVLSLLLIQCSTETDKTIAKNKLGEIDAKTSIEDLDVLFKNDSIVKIPVDVDFIREYQVYDGKGNELLIIKPKYDNDSIVGIEFIKIYNDSYKTESGISTLSTFKDLADNYSIDKIEPTFNSAIIFVDELNATFALDKKDLKLGEFDMRKIRKDQIPDMANILYITLWFE